LYSVCALSCLVIWVIFISEGIYIYHHSPSPPSPGVTVRTCAFICIARARDLSIADSNSFAGCWPVSACTKCRSVKSTSDLPSSSLALSRSPMPTVSSCIRCDHHACRSCLLAMPTLIGSAARLCRIASTMRLSVLSLRQY